MRHSISALVICGTLNAMAATASAQPTPEVLFQAQAGGASVTISRQASAQPRDVASIVWEPGVSVQVPLPDFLGEYSSATFWAGAKLILTGPSYNGGSRLVVVERASSTVVDSFYARSPSVSASGRMLVFTKHYPRRPISEPSDVYLLYDLALSATQNRLIEAGPPEEDRWTAGKPIFPDWNRTNQSVESQPNSAQVHVLRSPLAWYDDRWIFFIDSVSQHSFVVGIDTSNATSRSAELNPTALIDASGLPPSFDLASLVNAEQIEPLEITATTYRVKFTLSSRAITKTIELTW